MTNLSGTIPDTHDRGADDKAGHESGGAGPTTDPRPLFDRSVALAALTLDGVRTNQWDGPTPCPEFTVRGLGAHIVDVVRRVTALGEGTDPFSVPPVAGEVTDDEWTAALNSAADQQRRVWQGDAVLERTMTLPWATAPGAAMLATYIAEVTVHTWDLARATGQTPDWDDEVVEAALAASMRILPRAEERRRRFEEVRARMPEAMAANLAGRPPYADPVEVPGDAPAIDRLVAWSGRRP